MKDIINGGLCATFKWGENERFGLARSVAVMPGDKIKAEVWAKYVDKASTDTNFKLGLMASGASYFYGVQIPGVGQGVALYGGIRLTWDVFYNLRAQYGPSKWFGNDDSKWFK